MARANPNASFEAAARHLVRHLHDPDALRKNPLTRAFFGIAGSPRSARLADRNALVRIHGTFGAAAERYRDGAVRAGKAERARRQYVIAIGECLQRRSKETVAAELGVSLAQYYRDRAEVCLWICRYIRDLHDRPSEMVVQRFDPLRFSLDRAARLIELGETDDAIEEYERLLHDTVAAGQHIEILCEIALVHLRRNASEMVASALHDAEALLEASTSFSPEERAVAEARIVFARGAYTWPTDPALAMKLFETAMARLERLTGAWSDDARNLYVRLRFEYGEALTTFGDTRGSIETLSGTAAMLARSQGASPLLELKIQITLQALRMSLLVDPGGWESGRLWLERMQDLARRASGTGSVDLNLAALCAISQLQARAGDAAAALDTMRSALALPRNRSSCEVFSEVTQRMARTLMHTHLWHETAGILMAAGSPATATVAAARKTLKAEYALRQGAYRKVREAFSTDELERRPYGAVLAAGAAHALGARQQARSLIDRAIPAVEKAGVAVTIAQSYRIASRVTRDRRYARTADEIWRALSA